MIVFLIFICLFLFFFSILCLKKGWFWHIFRKNKTIYLTFDDGPQENLTKEILQILKNENIKATFFCVGENVLRYPEIFEHIKNDGHAIGNHSMKHLNGWKTSLKQYLNDIENANKIINSHLFRPPYGKITFRQWWALKKNFRIILWTHLSYDWDINKQPQDCFHLIKSAAKYGGIVVFHDNPKAKKNVLEVLPQFIAEAKKNGLNFKTLLD